jgi:hypothetical protein
VASTLSGWLKKRVVCQGRLFDFNRHQPKSNRPTVHRQCVSASPDQIHHRQSDSKSLSAMPRSYLTTLTGDDDPLHLVCLLTQIQTTTRTSMQVQTSIPTRPHTLNQIRIRTRHLHLILFAMVQNPRFLSLRSYLILILLWDIANSITFYGFSSQKSVRSSRTPAEQRRIDDTVAAIRLVTRHRDPYEEWERKTRKDAFVRCFVVLFAELVTHFFSAHGS